MGPVRLRFLSTNIGDAALLIWAKNKAKQTFEGVGIGSRTIYPDRSVMVRYGRDGGGLFAEVWRSAERYFPINVVSTIPTRSVFVMTRTSPGPFMTVTATYAGGGRTNYAWVIKNSAGDVVGDGVGSLINTTGGSINGHFEYINTPYVFGAGILLGDTRGAPHGSIEMPGVLWQSLSGIWNPTTHEDTTVWSSLGYEELYAADAAAGIGGVSTYVIAATSIFAIGETLTHETQTVLSINGTTTTSFVPKPVDAYGDVIWNGSTYVPMFNVKTGAINSVTYDHRLVFALPTDCISIPPAPESIPYPGTDPPGNWVADLTESRVDALARWADFYLKASDDTISALKGGVVPLWFSDQIKVQVPSMSVQVWVVDEDYEEGGYYEAQQTSGLRDGLGAHVTVLGAIVNSVHHGMFPAAITFGYAPYTGTRIFGTVELIYSDTIAGFSFVSWKDASVGGSVDVNTPYFGFNTLTKFVGLTPPDKIVGSEPTTPGYVALKAAILAALR